MPLYEYENAEHGITTTIACPLDRRPEEIVLRRRSVPSRITVGTGAKPPTMGDKLAQGYKALENAGQLTDRGGNYLPIKTIKEAIATPDPVEPAVTS